jgi:hypothetical protein
MEIRKFIGMHWVGGGKMCANGHGAHCYVLFLSAPSLDPNTLSNT